MKVAFYSLSLHKKTSLGKYILSRSFHTVCHIKKGPKLHQWWLLNVHYFDHIHILNRGAAAVSFGCAPYMDIFLNESELWILKFA